MLRGSRLGILAALVAFSTAQAQTAIDVAKITCKQFVLLKVADPKYIAIWLSGYYNGKRGTTTVDVESLEDRAQQIKTYCLYKDKGGTVMEAVEKVFPPDK
jgi:hypothetical protein